jgi:hypothetical protein
MQALFNVEHPDYVYAKTPRKRLKAHGGLMPSGKRERRRDGGVVNASAAAAEAAAVDVADTAAAAAAAAASERTFSSPSAFAFAAVVPPPPMLAPPSSSPSQLPTSSAGAPAQHGAAVETAESLALRLSAGYAGYAHSPQCILL